MNSKVKERMEQIKERYGLDKYRFHSYDIYRYVTAHCETEYILSTEWIPDHEEGVRDGETLPEGAAVVEVNLHSDKLKRLVFVEGKSFAEPTGINPEEIEEVISWIEEQTGLIHNQQFHLKSQSGSSYVFQECLNGVRVYGGGTIEVTFNSEGELVLFSVTGSYPDEDLVQKEPFTLQLEEVLDIAYEQFQYFEYPMIKRKQWIPLYGLKEAVLITNQEKNLFVPDDQSCIQMDELLSWDTPIQQPFTSRKSVLEPHFSFEQAVAREPHPDLTPLTDNERQECLVSVTDVMRQAFSDESGKWKLVKLYRDRGNIAAVLKPVQPDRKLFSRKIIMIIDPETFSVLHYMDTGAFQQAYEDFEHVPSPKMTIEEAWKKVKPELELKPVYVYHRDEQQYILCGKIDCSSAVDVSTGDIIKF